MMTGGFEYTTQVGQCSQLFQGQTFGMGDSRMFMSWDCIELKMSNQKTPRAMTPVIILHPTANMSLLLQLKVPLILTMAVMGKWMKKSKGKEVYVQGTPTFKNPR
jgi:hypothetical protein